MSEPDSKTAPRTPEPSDATGAAGLPAFIVATAENALRRVVELTVLDRLVVTLHRAGFGPITLVATDELSAPERATRLGIRVERARVLPIRSGRALLTEVGVWLSLDDARRLAESGGRLVTASGDPLPVGVVPAVDPAGVMEQLAGLRETGSERAVAVTDERAARRLERALWRSMGSSSDGFVDTWINRPVGRLLSRRLVRTGISPNAVSTVSILVGVLSGVLFWIGHPSATIAGAVLLQLSAMMDCVDGELARLLFKESSWGRWLDLVGDQVVHVTVFAGIAFGLARRFGAEWPLWAGGLAVAGAILSFLVVLRGILRPRLRGDARMQRILDRATTRDFSVLLLALTIADRLSWFLWLTAVGSHVFWLLLWRLQRRALRKPAGGSG